MTPPAHSDPDPGPAGLPDDVARLAAELEQAIRTWERDPAPWPEERFGSLALRAFRLQHEHVAPYRRYCREREAGPDRVEDWREVPPVPTAAFRAAELSAAPAAAPLRFRTSGTTGSAARRGLHVVATPSLYRASAEAGFRRLVLDGRGYPEEAGPDLPPLETPVPILSLVPCFADSDDGSLAWMCDAVRDRFGGPGSEVAAGPGEVDWEAAGAWARRAADAGEPVVVLTTTLALDAWTRRLASDGVEPRRLPAGSRIMDTGGAKGRPGLSREEVLSRAEAALGVPPDRVVNELGMTELLSQRYGRPDAGRLHGPPWLRTRALDPVTVEPVPEGEVGILCHLDLANVASVSAVLTGDLGTVVEGAVEHRGRVGGTPPRGCSLATAELLAAGEAGSTAGGGDTRGA